MSNIPTNFVTCDLSLKSSGLCYFRNGKLYSFAIVDSLEKQTPEDTLINNARRIADFVDGCNVESLDGIYIEKFAFNAKSGEKDRLWANCWLARCYIRLREIEAPFTEISVSSWRSPLFTKFENDAIKLALAQFKTCKLKGLKGEERKAMIQRREALERKADKKWATVAKLPDDVASKFFVYIKERDLPLECVFDLTDAYFIGQYVLSGKQPVKVKKKRKKVEAN